MVPVTAAPAGTPEHPVPVRPPVAALSVSTRDTLGRPRELTGVTVSVGVSTTARFGYELPDLLVAADAALLTAKASGRNAVTFA